MFEKNKKAKVALIILAAFCLVFVWTIWGNTALKVNNQKISSNRIPKAFDGYRIAQVSDLHNGEIGPDNEKLIARLKNAQPDMIAISGDIIDCHKTDIDVALNFVQKAVAIAPCYYVTGNHEHYIAGYDEFKAAIVEMGVVVLEESSAKIERSGESINLIGVNDPTFWNDSAYGHADSAMKRRLDDLVDNHGDYQILLSHRPELFDVYVESGVDLVLSGHAHGGQVRLPLIGGLYAPNQGILPQYDSGLYTWENTNMIVSRGIGNSAFPLRFNNRPEVILIELNSMEE